jgi:hypothetical protein
MISSGVIDKYSIPLEQQMMKIGRLEPDIEAAFLQAKQTCRDDSFIDDAYRTFRSIGGKSGDAALEVYRDLEANIHTLTAFLQKYQEKIQNPDYSDVIR